jgi:putative ABC transport system substrate-binding protein
MAAGNPAIEAAKEATQGTDIPVLMTFSGAPVETKLVASLEQPGGNVTGLTAEYRQLSRKRLRLLQEITGVSHVAILWNPSDAVAQLEYAETGAEALAMGLPLESLEVSNPGAIDPALDVAHARNADGLIVLGDDLTFYCRKQIADGANRHHLRSIHANRAFVDAGGLLSYGPISSEFYEVAAVYAYVLLLKRGTPEQLPVKQPTSFKLVINLQTASAIGLTISSSAIVQADDVVW